MSEDGSSQKRTVAEVVTEEGGFCEGFVDLRSRLHYPDSAMRWFLGLLLLSLVFVGGCTSWFDSNARLFEDPNLERVVREAIQKPTGELRPEDLPGLRRLKAEGLGIVSLKGIQHCIDLEHIRLDDNQIINVRPLSSLSRLTLLHLDNNRIVDISPLFGLTNLEELFLDGNIVDIRGLPRLRHLNALSLENCRISDISPLAGLTNLIWLTLGNNQIVDISVLSNFTKLSLLSLDNNKIVDINALVENRGLPGAWIDIRHNNLDLTPGSSDMKNIEALLDQGTAVDYEPQN